jgi:hypothetical protein
MRVQKEKIASVIKAEQKLLAGCLVDSFARCDNPGHCAVGALLYEAGMSNRELSAMWGHHTLWGPGSVAARLLASEYGLTRDLAQIIVNWNDSIGDDTQMDLRRARVLACVSGFPEEIEGEQAVAK